MRELLTSVAVYSAFAIPMAIALLVWAIRNGQFRDQQHARELPLVSPPLDEAQGAEHDN